MTAGRQIRAGAAYLELRANDNQLVKALDRSKRLLGDFGASARRVGSQLVAGGAGIVAPLALATRIFVKFGDELDKISQRTGVSADSLSELRFAAEQTGADIGTLEKGIRAMQRSIFDLNRGLATQKEAYDAIGLSIGDLSGLNPEQQFKLIADRLSDIEDPSRRAAIAMQIFGRAGSQLIPLINGGAKAIEEYQEQARRLGLTISQDAAKRAADLTDAFNINRSVVRRVAFEVGDALQPALLSASETLTGFLVGIGDWIGRNRELVVLVAKVGGVVVVLGGGLLALGIAAQVGAFALGGLVAIITGVGTVIGVAGAALAALLTPMGLVLAAVVGLGVALATQTSIGGEAISYLVSKFQELGAIAGDTFRGIVDAIKGGDFELAARILWTGLKLAWFQGVAELRTIWGEFEDFLLRSINTILTAVEVGTAKIGGALLRGAGGLLDSPLLQGIANGLDAAAVGALGNKSGRDAAIDGRRQALDKQYQQTLEELKNELAALNKQAAEGAKDTAGIGRRVQDLLAGLGEFGAGPSTFARTSFGTTGLETLGGVSIQRQIRDYAKQTANNTKKLASGTGSTQVYTP